jgi:hypothetical protein
MNANCGSLGIRRLTLGCRRAEKQAQEGYYVYATCRTFYQNAISGYEHVFYSACCRVVPCAEVAMPR